MLPNTLNSSRRTAMPSFSANMGQPTTMLGGIKNTAKSMGLDYNSIGDNTMRGGLSALAPSMFYAIQQQNARLPAYYDAINQAINQANPQGNAASINSMRTTNMANAQDQARQLLTALLTGGLGIGARQGAALDATNQANSQTANYAAQMSSPEAQAKQMETLMQLHQLALTNPVLNEVMQYLNGMLNRDQVAHSTKSTGGGIFGGLGQLAGMASGMGWKPFGSK